MATYYYSSLFKQDDVRVTQGFKSTHKALDLSRGVVRQPLYSPNKLGRGKVSYVATSYEDSNGKLWENSLVVYIKYDSGYTLRFFHGYVKDRVVNVGDVIVPGKQIYRTGSSGNSTGDHVHVVLVNSKNIAIDPSPYILNDKISYKIGERLFITGDYMNIRSASYSVVGKALKGAVCQIVSVADFKNGYQYYVVDFADKKGVLLADTGYNEKTTKTITNLDASIPIPTKTELETVKEQLTEAQKQVKLLEDLNTKANNKISDLERQISEIESVDNADLKRLISEILERVK